MLFTLLFFYPHLYLNVFVCLLIPPKQQQQTQKLFYIENINCAVSILVFSIPYFCNNEPQPNLTALAPNSI